MDHTLRCNSLKCRKELNDHAVVTTCSHVFCVDCANNCQLSRQGPRDGQQPICPACDMLLPNLDDVVITNLNPSEDYKTSVLSGLSPNVIMECAGRALSFWAYQTTQEIVYQEYLAKNLTEKYGTLSANMDKVIHNANGEISHLRGKMDAILADQNNLRKKNEELVQAFREKSRKQLQTQEQYDKLKRSAMLGQVQNAASDAVEHTVQASVAGNGFVDRVENQQQRPDGSHLFPNQQTDGTHHLAAARGGGIGNMPPPSVRRTNSDTWAGFGSQNNIHQNHPLHTPSSHRQRLATGIIPNPQPGHANYQTTETSMSQRLNTPVRQPLVSMTGNGATPPGFAGYGMSAGLKVSNPPGITGNGFVKPPIRSRVAQRPASNFAMSRSSAFGPPNPGGMMSNGNIYY